MGLNCSSINLANFHLASSPNNDTGDFPFHQLVPDCRELVFSYCLLSFYDIIRSPVYQTQNPNHQQCVSNLKFALRYFKCRLYSVFLQGHSEREKSALDFDIDQEIFSRMYSFIVEQYSHAPYWPPHYANILPRAENLVELRIDGSTAGLTCDMFRHLRSLRELRLGLVMDGCRGEYITDEMFTHLHDLKHLEISVAWLTDKAFENLHNAGSRLEKLEIADCPQITDAAFSFLRDGSLRELRISHCEDISGEGLTLLHDVEQLHLEGMDGIDCREAFKCLHETAYGVSMIHCSNSLLNEKAMSYLKGISSLRLRSALEGQLSNEAFRHLSGSIKYLEIEGSTGTRELSKDILWHLVGIKHLILLDTGVKVEAKDLPALKQIFGNVSYLSVSSDFADDSTLKKVRKFIEGNGGAFEITPWYLWEM